MCRRQGRLVRGQTSAADATMLEPQQQPGRRRRARRCHGHRARRSGASCPPCAGTRVFVGDAFDLTGQPGRRKRRTPEDGDVRIHRCRRRPARVGHRIALGRFMMFDRASSVNSSSSAVSVRWNNSRRELHPPRRARHALRHARVAGAVRPRVGAISTISRIGQANYLAVRSANAFFRRGIANVNIKTEGRACSPSRRSSSSTVSFRHGPDFQPRRTALLDPSRSTNRLISSAARARVSATHSETYPDARARAAESVIVHARASPPAIAFDDLGRRRRSRRGNLQSNWYERPAALRRFPAPPSISSPAKILIPRTILGSAKVEAHPRNPSSSAFTDFRNRTLLYDDGGRRWQSLVRLTHVETHVDGLCAPRLGNVRRNGVCPPSNPSLGPPPERAFCPLCRVRCVFHLTLPTAAPGVVFAHFSPRPRLAARSARARLCES